MMRIVHALLLGSLLVVGCERNDSAAPVTPPAPTAEQVDRETARLNEWFDARYEEQLDFSPLTKTRLGRKDDYDRIDDFSESGAGRAARMAAADRSRPRARLRPRAADARGADVVRPLASTRCERAEAALAVSPPRATSSIRWTARTRVCRSS